MHCWSVVCDQNGNQQLRKQSARVMAVTSNKQGSSSDGRQHLVCRSIDRMGWKCRESRLGRRPRPANWFRGRIGGDDNGRFETDSLRDMSSDLIVTPFRRYIGPATKPVVNRNFLRRPIYFGTATRSPRTGARRNCKVVGRPSPSSQKGVARAVPTFSHHKCTCLRCADHDLFSLEWRRVSKEKNM